jgi:Ni/Fe-hydrogenase subunit HybB-like protein
VLWVLALLGAVAAAWRMVCGLGATTDLSDAVPWGIWKVVNMIAGVALATGGFVLAFVVHVLGLRSWRPIVRPAILVALLGYGSSCAALLMDIGLPDRFWHPFVFWNPHSFLFEVFWCVSLYFTVTILEFTPIALEGSRFRKPYALLRKISLPVVVLGISFSTLHHTSLGSLFLVSPTRLHPIWFTPMLPVLFIVSAVGAGMMSVVLVTLGVSRLYRRRAPLDLLSKVAAAAAVVLALFFALRIGDLAARGQFASVLSGSAEGGLLIAELALLAVVPCALVAIPRVRRSGAGLASAALCAVAGLVLDRLDVGVIGYLSDQGASYVPTLPELALAVGIPAAAGLVFLALVERLPVFEGLGRVTDPAGTPGPTDFEPQTLVWRRAFSGGLERASFLVLFVVPVAAGAYQAAAATGAPRAVLAPLALEESRKALRIDGDGDGAFVDFPHDDHKVRLGDAASCRLCHHADLPGDHDTACWRCHTAMEGTAAFFDHERHHAAVAKREGFTGVLGVNRTCAICHPSGAPRSADGAASCRECHATDMRLSEKGERLPARIANYTQALHGQCVRCHEERAAAAVRPHLAECGTCHDAKSR